MHLCSAAHATGLALAAEVNRTLVLPRLLVDGSAAEFGYGCNMSPSHIPACRVVLDCHIAAAEMHCMTGGAARSRCPWSAIAPAAPYHRDVYNADLFVAALQGQGVQLLPHPPDVAQSLQLRLGEHYDALGTLQRTYAGVRHVRCVQWVAESRACLLQQ